ncbi:hypothetical protein D4M94_08490 [Enterococcus sp. T0168A.B-11]|nr:hypothetical protein D4M94_08490 [Enterococcus sp. T0168A.B-11]
MEVVTEELSGGHRLFGIRDCDKTFVTAFFCTKKKFSPNRKICHKDTYFKYESTITNKLKR